MKEDIAKLNVDSINESITNLNNDVSSLTTSVDNLTTQITNHINNKDNPHAVTKTQVGLGNVDNTADKDKPVSTAQQAAIDKAIEDIHIKVITQSDYTALETKDNNTLYFIIDS